MKNIRTTILKAIARHFQMIVQNLISNPTIASEYIYKADALIEILEIED
jgi:hypothetical protein